MLVHLFDCFYPMVTIHSLSRIWLARSHRMCTVVAGYTRETPAVAWVFTTFTVRWYDAGIPCNT
jgi:hypothetical protein